MITYINYTIKTTIHLKIMHILHIFRILIAHTHYRLLHQINCVKWIVIYHKFQKQFLVCRLQLRELTLDPIELRQIEDLRDVEFLKQMFRILSLM
jgi:hypothetical protein